MKIKRQCRNCKTTNKKDFSSGGVTYCDKCVLKTAKKLNFKLIKNI
jgi:hypothetical protein